MIVHRGGDCWASTDAILILARKIGLHAEMRDGSNDLGAGFGHKQVISDHAFYNTGIQKVYIPDSVTEIQKNAFQTLLAYRNNRGIEEFPLKLIELPANIKKLGLDLSKTVVMYHGNKSQWDQIQKTDTYKAPEKGKLFYSSNGLEKSIQGSELTIQAAKKATVKIYTMDDDIQVVNSNSDIATAQVEQTELTKYVYQNNNCDPAYDAVQTLIIDGLKAGSSKITLTNKCGSLSFNINVVDKPAQSTKADTYVKVKKIKLHGISHKIAAGKKIRLEAEIFPKNANKSSVKWISSNSRIASVNQNGLVKIKRNSGCKSVIIKAKATDGSGTTSTWKITSMKSSVKNIKIRGAKTAHVGKYIVLKATIKAPRKANKQLKWTSSNKAWAFVDKKGVVIAKPEGKGHTVVITARSTDGSNKRSSIRIAIK